MKKILPFLLTLFILLFSLITAPKTSKADGMILPPPNYYLRETGQKAAIVYEGGQETMTVQVSFEGDAKDFAWIVPTPSRPTVTEASDLLFTALQKLTTTDYDYSIYPMALESGVSKQAATPKVSVVETKRVGIFKIEVLAANNADYLAKWLKEHSYQYPEKQSYILDSYIENGWYFTAIKVDAALAQESSTSEKLKTGHATPLKFVFKSDKIVFPLKISSIIAEQIIKTDQGLTDSEQSEIATDYPIITDRSVSIYLYVFSDHKVNHSSFTTEQAKWVKKSQIETLAQDSQGNPWFEPKNRKMYLTKLYASMNYSEMTQDIFLTQANDNKPVGVDYVIWWVFLLLILSTILAIAFSPFGFLFIIFAIVYHFTVKPFWKKFSAIMEILLIALLSITTIIVCLLYATVATTGDSATAIGYIWPLALGGTAVIAFMIIWRIIESRSKKLE